MHAPKQPDPNQTAATQGAWNSYTANQQQALNMTDQVSPWGTLMYNQTGSQTITDPNGKQVEIPRYTAVTTLSPGQQAIQDQTNAADLNLATLANQQSARIGDILNTPFQAPDTLSNQDVEKWAYDLASPRILAQQTQNQDALRQQLINSGIRPGTPQWDSEMTRLTNANTDQINQLALNGRSQAVAEQQQAYNQALQTRNQPINEIIGLMSGTQIQNPNSTFAQTPQTQVGGVDYSGQVQQNYQNAMNSYNAQVGALGGLFGAGLGMFKFSDSRLKTDIRRIGATDLGTPVYEFRYAWGGPKQVGYMAQDLIHTQPHAVAMTASGDYLVNYDRVM